MLTKVLFCTSPTHGHDLQVKVTDFNLLFSLVNICTIFTHACDLEVKVTDLDIFIYVFEKGFMISFCPDPLLDFIYIW